jgi:hypothetical protein
MEAYGVAFNADFDHWFVLSEIGTNNRDDPDGIKPTVKSPAYSIGAGYRVGKWTPFLNFGQYKDNYADGPATFWRRTSLTVRYDLTSSSAVKAQFDHYWEKLFYVGNANVFRISYDMVF